MEQSCKTMFPRRVYMIKSLMYVVKIDRQAGVCLAEDVVMELMNDYWQLDEFRTSIIVIHPCKLRLLFCVDVTTWEEPYGEIGWVYLKINECNSEQKGRDIVQNKREVLSVLLSRSRYDYGVKTKSMLIKTNPFAMQKYTCLIVT